MNNILRLSGCNFKIDYLSSCYSSDMVYRNNIFETTNLYAMRTLNELMMPN